MHDSNTEDNFLSQEAIHQLKQIVGDQNLNTESIFLQDWCNNTLGSFREIVGVIYPENIEQIKSILKICNELNILFYAISSGKNWGYGGASPVENNVLILDLSKMNKILEFNEDLHYVTVEPGVTQQDLYNYMKKNNYHFMVPTTGAGPDVSLLGNAVERGYGITPHEDHFGSLLSLKAILPNGEIYNSSLAELGGFSVDKIFKWNIGPYLDGIFTQSNLGIVVEVTIALVPTPKSVTQFVVFLDEENFESGIVAVKNIKTKLNGIVGGVNLMNKRRLLAMIETDWSQDKASEEIHVIEFAKKQDLPDWAMAGALYGENEVIGAAKKIIKKECGKISNKIVFLNKKKYELAQLALKVLPLTNLKKMLDNAGRALEVLEGTPSKVALPLSYLKNKKG
ncbi:MAG: FAD-binding oxidoreductase, partial [Bdellovibrionales bacterium]|nr:FAD-binding oxidoreductase [Bdellovibrionales bacterium]